MGWKAVLLGKMTLALLFLVNVALGANIEVANNWLHHAMDPFELGHHFGVESSHQVDPMMYQIINIKTEEGKSKRSGSSDSHNIDFEAFGLKRKINLKLNKKLVSSNIQAFVTDGQNRTKVEMPSNTKCHFLHNSEDLSAALSNCDTKYTGHLLHQGSIFEIKPLDSKYHGMMGQMQEEDTLLHIVTRRPISDLPNFENDLLVRPGPKVQFGITKEKKSGMMSKRGTSDLTIETALFMDPKASQMFMRYYRNDQNQLQNMILAFMNQIQSTYHFKSLGRVVDFVIVYLEIMNGWPYSTNAEREAALQNFCKYQVRHFMISFKLPLILNLSSE